MRRADPQRVKKADPQRVLTSQNQRDDEHSTETARCCSGDHSPDQQFDGETVENKISHSTVQDVRGQNKTHLRDVTATKQQTIRSTLPTAAIKTSLKMQKKTGEVPQVHVIDKIASSCYAETEEELERRPKEMRPWRTEVSAHPFQKTAEAHQEQYINRVVDVPVEKEPGDAEDSGSCCTKWYSDADRPLTFLLILLRRLPFKHRRLKTLRTRVSTSEERSHQVPK